MRLMMSLAAIMLGLLAGGFWTNHSLQVSTDEISRQIDKVFVEVKADNWQTALRRTNELEQIWDDKARWWPIFLDHQEMDNIDFSMARVKEYVAGQEDTLSMGQLSELKLMVEHIPKKEAVNLKNIL